MGLFSLFLFATLLTCASNLLLASYAALTNQTFDDTDPAFSWNGPWISNTPSSRCPGCQSQPNPSLTYQGTWHDGDQDVLGGSFKFTGSAVYIYGIDQASTSTISEIETIFTLSDANGGVVAGPTPHSYAGVAAYVYSALFFSATGLDENQGLYTVGWTVQQRTDGGQLQVALFDYAVVVTGSATANGGGNPGTSNGQTNSEPATPRTTGTPSPTDSATTPAPTTQLFSSPSTNTTGTSYLGKPQNSSASSQTGVQGNSSILHRSNPVVPAILGSLAAVLVLLLLVYLWRRRRNGRERQLRTLAVAPMPLLSPVPEWRPYPSKFFEVETTDSEPTRSAVRDNDEPLVNSARRTQEELEHFGARIAELEARLGGGDHEPPPYADP